MRVDTGPLRRAAETVPRALHRELRIAFGKALAHLEDRVVTERLSGDPLRKRTGALARGWFRIVDGDTIGTLVGLLATNVPYAAAHEFGAIIRPVRGKWLWIPGRKLLTPSGVFKGWDGVPWGAIFFRRSKRNPANLVALAATKTLIAPRRARRTNGGWADGAASLLRGHQEVEHFATLAPQVMIPARLGLRETARSDEAFRVGLFNAAIRSALNSSTR